MGFFLEKIHHYTEEKKLFQRHCGIHVEKPRDSMVFSSHDDFSINHFYNSSLGHSKFPAVHGFFFHNHIIAPLSWIEGKPHAGEKNIFQDIQEKPVFPKELHQKSPLWKDVVFLHQIHSNTVLHIDENNAIPWNFKGDGLWCSTKAKRGPRLSLGITTADCLPLLLWNPRQEKIMALHGGWRGCTQGILRKGLGIFQETSAVLKKDLHVLIGPSIFPEFFEVSWEIFIKLQDEQNLHNEGWSINTNTQWFFVHEGKIYVDLSFYGQCLLEPLVANLCVMDCNTYGSPYSYRYAVHKKNSHYSLIKSVICGPQ